MKSAHVRDVVAAMRVIANFKDELAWTRYLTLWDGVGEVTAANLIGNILLCDDISDCISIVQGARLKNVEAYKALEAIYTLDSNPSEAIDILVEIMEGILKKRYENWDLRKRDFSALKLVAKKAVNISDFVTDYILDPSAEITLKFDTEVDNDKITISTIHSAKGLESEVCYILNVAPESYPSLHATTFDEVEEERRCLYVALTRAKDELHLMSRSISRFGLINSPRDFNTIEIGRRITSLRDEHIKGIVTDVNQSSESVMISYCIDGESIPHTTDEKEFKKRFSILSKNEEAGMNYFFNNLPPELVYMPNPEKDKSKSFGSVSTPASSGWDPFDEFNFS
jgi:hypothetical protein